MIEEESKFLLKTKKIEGYRPIISIGTFISLDAECIIAGSSDRNIRFLDYETLDEIAKCTVDKRSVTYVAVSEMSPEGDDPIIVTGGKDRMVQVWNPTEGTLEKNIELPTDEVRSLAIYQGSVIYLLVGTKDSKVILWDVKINKLITIFQGHRASVHSVLITSLSNNLDNHSELKNLCLASGGADRTVRTWDIQTDKKKKKFRHARSISTMVVANKGNRPILVTGGVERVIRLWDITTGVLLRTLGGHLDKINSLTLWEGFQMLLISSSSDHTIRVFDIVSGECICILKGHKEAVLGVTIADYDNPKLVSCSDDLTIRQFDLTAITNSFYYTDDAKLGTRNSEPAYLPEVSYTAPDELDRNLLTKEQRKLIRKQLKREKRLKLSGKLKEGEYSSIMEKVNNRLTIIKTRGTTNENHLITDNQEKTLKPTEEEENTITAKIETNVENVGENDEKDKSLKDIRPVSPVEQAPRISSYTTKEELSIAYKRTSIRVVKNVLGKVLGLGNMNSVGIEPTVEDKEFPEKVEAQEENVEVQEEVVKPGLLHKAESMDLTELLKKADACSLDVEDSPPGSSRKFSSTSRSSKVFEEEEEESVKLRSLVNAAQNKYNIAIVEKELQSNRDRSKAAEKLAERLKKRKGLSHDSNLETNNDGDDYEKDKKEYITNKSREIKTA